MNKCKRSNNSRSNYVCRQTHRCESNGWEFEGQRAQLEAEKEKRDIGEGVTMRNFLQVKDNALSHRTLEQWKNPLMHQHEFRLIIFVFEARGGK